jgi:hypothetical protein
MLRCLVVSVWIGRFILTTLPLRYADCILKGFASNISIIITGLVSLIAFADFQLTGAMFALGAVLVLASSLLYVVYEPPAEYAEPKPATS